MLYEYHGPFISMSVSRHFSVDPHRLFAACLDPASAGNWLFNTKTSKVRYELDTRVGGAFTVTRERAGKTYVAVGRYVVIDPPRRLSFNWSMPQYAADMDTVTIDIVPEGDGCLLTITEEGLRPGYETSSRNGWSKMLDLLQAGLQ